MDNFMNIPWLIMAFAFLICMVRLTDALEKIANKE
jgi:hypothetical protein